MADAASRFFIRLMIRFLRGAISVMFFGIFAVGAILMSPFMFLLGSPRFCQPLVRATWRPYLKCWDLAGEVGVRYDGSREVKGSVLVANHPSLIDVVIMVSLFPKTLYVAKHSLLKDFFLSGIVRFTSLPDDERLPEAAGPYLRDGWNVLVFPEGSRTPMGPSSRTPVSEVEMRPFHRGAAQVALRNGVPLVPFGISLTRRVVAKGQKAWDLGTEKVFYTIRRGAEIPVAMGSGVLRSEAMALTDRIRKEIKGLL